MLTHSFQRKSIHQNAVGVVHHKTDADQEAAVVGQAFSFGNNKLVNSLNSEQYKRQRKAHPEIMCPRIQLIAIDKEMIGYPHK